MAEIFDNTVFAPGNWASGGADELGVWAGGTAGTGTAVLTGTLTRVGDDATAVIGGQTVTLRAYSDLPDGVLFTTTDFATFYAFLATPFAAGATYPLSYTVAGQSDLACFLAGTRIATPRGEVPVERLRPGMRVVTVGQGVRRVRWVGQRRIAPAAPRVWPVRIAAHAFAPGRPRRPLLLSPDHAVFAGGALVPAGALVNGASIVRMPMPAVAYWHVELPAHALLLAEGLAAESYLDTGNRGSFDRPDAPRQRRGWARDGCARLLLTPAAQAGVRRRLLARAGSLGHRLTDDPGLVVAAEQTRLPATRRGAVWHVTLPPGTDRVRLISRTAIPAETVPWSVDRRRLGVAVTAVRLDGAGIAPDDPRRATGWHAPEPGLHWTDGDAELLCRPSAAGARRLEIATVPLLRYWLHPPGHHGSVIRLDAARLSAHVTGRLTGRKPGSLFQFSGSGRPREREEQHDHRRHSETQGL